ncbi:MAG: hypothetical protein QOH90_374 [Actinomycetota bacterium]|jgi:hypothetical protein|nr:hypothetical protein [Actinomycetota bacterium]
MEIQSTESTFRPSVPLIFGIAIAIVALVVAATFALTRREGKVAARPGDAPTVAAPALKQAAWHIERRVVGDSGGRSHKKVLKVQLAAVSATVTDLYDALLLHPEDAPQITHDHMSPAAARALGKSKIAFGGSIERVQTLRRAAAVSLQGPSASHAAARVAIKLRARTGKKEIHLQHHATLWLERAGSAWRVIAFDTSQRPLR